MAYRAFLSHGSVDKPFIMTVAKNLGRARATVDQWDFEAGDAFLDAIEEHVAKCDLFVLFASNAALQRPWVNVEQRLAELLTALIPDRRVLVLMLDDVRAKLPEWLQRSRAVPVHNPNEATSYINRVLAELMRDSHGHRFVGRAHEYDELEGKILTLPPPRILYLSGITGVGRQTLAEEVGRRLLNLPEIIPPIKIEPADGLSDIVAKLAPHGANLRSDESLVDVVRDIKNSNEEELLIRFVTYCRRIHDSQRLIVFRDDGGLVSSDGLLNPDLKSGLARLDSDKGAYCALIARRALDDVNLPFKIAALRLNRMPNEDMRRLFMSLMHGSKYEIDLLYVDDLLEYLHGFPPAAYLAAQIVNDYGPAVLEGDRRPLTEFETNTFVAQLLRDNILTTSRQNLLSGLLSYSPLPVEILEEITGSVELINDLRYLIDYGFVNVDSDGYYSLAPPLTSAVAFRIGHKLVDHHVVASALKAYLDRYAYYEKSVDLHRALFRALAYSGQSTDNDQAIELTSDVFRLQERLYHDRRYEQSIEYGKLVLERQPGNLRCISFIIRACAQLHKTDYARSYLDKIRGRERPGRVAYLEGFISRKDGKHRGAIDLFKKAIALGHDDVTVNREIAFAYYALNELDSAFVYLEKARARDSNNRYVLDLAVQIAVRRGDIADARTRLADLGRVDKPDHVLHRTSDVSYFEGDYEKAYGEAVESCRLAGDQVPLAFKASVIRCEIKLGKLDDAKKHIDELDADYPELHHDVKMRLRIHYALATNDPQSAAALWDRLGDKSNVENLPVRVRILTALLASMDIDDPRRRETQLELDRLHVEPPLMRMA